MTTFDLNDFLPYQLNVLAERISRDFAQLYEQSYGITVPEWRVVAHLSQQDHVSVREICARVNMDKSRVSRAASRLEQAGYVTKSENPQDKRLVTLSLTDAGQRMIADLAPRARAFEEAFLTALGQEGPQFRHMIQRLIETDER